MSSLGNNTDGLEVGMVVAWTLSANPSDNYLECNGQVVDSSKYPKLYTLMHNTPDYRGIFLRGLGGNSATLGELQGDAIRNITGYFGRIDDNMGDYVNGAFYLKIAKGWDWSSYATDTNSQILYFDASRVVPVAVENRPINKAVRYFIKAK